MTRARLLGAVGAVDVLLGLTLVVATGRLDPVDRRILDIVDPDLVWGTPQRLCDVVVELLQPAVTATALLLVAAIASRHARSTGPLVGALMVVAAVALPLLVVKVLVDRAPISGSGTSFPSGHEASLVAYLGTIARTRPPRLRRAAVWGTAALAVVMAVALVVTGTHWASDVIGGAALGAAVLLAPTSARWPVRPAAGRAGRAGRGGRAGGGRSRRRRTRWSTAGRPS
ncbi:phosphatase PAP2 family protein [Nocardioides sp. DS6]|uniref:Phosphatase PAP2 family protein n=1 Tax=Nocardioides eburneus TaxID=3231482 RepID=A0ABV3T418_9ACTN